MAARRQECSICMDSFKNPKLISCHHSFCCKCLEDYVRVNLRNGRFNCPICRTSVELPVGGVPTLQSNFYIDTEAGDIFACNVCGPKKVACSRCVDCEENLCQSCCKVHEKLKVSRHHKICDLETMDSKTKGKIRQRIFCQEHPEEEMKLVCQDCKVVICMVCKVVKHENHGTEPVAVAAAEMKKNIQAKLNECSDKLRHIDASKQKIKEFDRKINDAEQEELKAVDDQCLQLHKAIDQEGAKMKARIKHVYHDLRQQNTVLAGVIEDDFKACSNTMDNVLTLSDQATDIDIIKKGYDLKQFMYAAIRKTDHSPSTCLEKKLFSPANIKSSELASLVGRIQDSTKLSPQAKFGSKYKVPQLFGGQKAKTTSITSDSDNASGDDGQQRKKYVYIDMYRAYCKKNRLPPADFNTYRIKGSGFVSMITLYGETYGKGEFFPTAEEAEDAAAKLAVQSLGLDQKDNSEQLTAIYVESRGMEPALSLSSTSKQKFSPSGSSSVKSLSSEDENHDLVADERTLWNPKEYAKRPLPPKVVIPNEGSYIDVHVIKVDSPSNFVCILYEQMDHLNQLHQDMLEYFTPPPQLIIQEDEINLDHLYAGNASGIWYRVKVQQFVGNRLLYVYLVDIGEYSVMSLEELQPLPWKFWKIPMQAFTARLGGIKPMGGSWSEGAKLKFIELAFEKDLVGHVISNSGDDGAVSLRLVDTSQEDLDICIDEVLLTKTFAVIA